MDDVVRDIDELSEITNIGDIACNYINTPFKLPETVELDVFWERHQIGTRYKTPSYNEASSEENLRVESFWSDPRRDGHIQVRSISGWLPATRGDVSISVRSEALYFPLQEKPKGDESTLVINCMEKKEDDIEKLFKKKLSIICGKRGIGKTAALNYWLNVYGNTRLEQKNILWFKIDAARLYDTWKNGAAGVPCICGNCSRPLPLAAEPVCVTRQHEA